jgi:hypothetical protein
LVSTAENAVAQEKIADAKTRDKTLWGVLATTLGVAFDFILFITV